MSECKKGVLERTSGIELAKIMAIVLIVMAHMVQSLSDENVYVSSQGYVLDISKATTDVRKIILLIILHMGKFGNALFFISSAWFFLQQQTNKKKKWFFLLVEVWTVSVIIFILSCIIFPGGITKEFFVRSLFPTLFANNWYMTCYLLFYLLFPMLNGIIRRMNQVQLFRCTVCLMVLYIFLGGMTGRFFATDLTLWVAIYFVVAYIQKYLKKVADDKRINSKMLLFNTVCFVGAILLTEFAGLHISFLSEKMTLWLKNGNPFEIFMALAVFNIARNVHFRSKTINCLSGCSLLIYLIHGNIILKTHVRPAMWEYVYKNYGYSHVILWLFALTIVVVVTTAAIAALYSLLIQTHVNRASDKLFVFLKSRYLALEAELMKK